MISDTEKYVKYEYNQYLPYQNKNHELLFHKLKIKGY